MLPPTERSVPPTTPKSEPWVTITALEGTGRTTSATSSPVPSSAAVNVPVLPNLEDGSFRSGTPVPSPTRKRTRRRPKITQTITEYRFIVYRALGLLAYSAEPLRDLLLRNGEASAGLVEELCEVLRGRLAEVGEEDLRQCLHYRNLAKKWWVKVTLGAAFILALAEVG
jgi:hypothetical protein